MSNPPLPTKDYKKEHMAEQSSVEWLENQLTLALGDELKDLRGLFVVAKEMDKKERMYSEEDMAESFMACWKANVSDGIECKLSFKEWFEQYKK
jgi:hypothetical protein